MRNVTVPTPRLVRRLAYALRDGNVRKAAVTRIHLLARAAAMTNEVAREAVVRTVAWTEFVAENG